MTPPTEHELRAILAPVLGIEPRAIDPDTSLVVLGISSLEVMRLVSRWRKQGVRADFEALIGEPTLKGWLAHFETLTGPENKGAEDTAAGESR
ncbi:phosphopantetheine-binding protein [Streptomyces sp. NPDC005017]|uniref:phosphopantetheine-binding protein n=1 Tax=Streptomyces sp. NPDC005017 TaxID=3364706 RepID=UPI00367D33E6